MGAELIVISDQDSLLKKSQLGFKMAPGIPEWLSQSPTMFCRTTFARQLALKKD